MNYYDDDGQPINNHPHSLGEVNVSEMDFLMIPDILPEEEEEVIPLGRGQRRPRRYRDHDRWDAIHEKLQALREARLDQI